MSTPKTNEAILDAAMTQAEQIPATEVTNTAGTRLFLNSKWVAYYFKSPIQVLKYDIRVPEQGVEMECKATAHEIAAWLKSTYATLLRGEQEQATEWISRFFVDPSQTP